VDPLEFLARVLMEIPDKGHGSTRYYGWYDSRPRGMRFAGRYDVQRVLGRGGCA
jgi:hypothetical protein